MIRHIIREFLAHPAELLTFRTLSRLVASDADVLHAIAEQRLDLLMFAASSDQFVKLFPDAAERIASDGVEQAIAEVRAMPSERDARRDRPSCDYFSTRRSLWTCSGLSFRHESLTRRCCWRAICRVRALNPQAIDEDGWREVCRSAGTFMAGRTLAASRDNRFYVSMRPSRRVYAPAYSNA